MSFKTAAYLDFFNGSIAKMEVDEQVSTTDNTVTSLAEINLPVFARGYIEVNMIALDLATASTTGLVGRKYVYFKSDGSTVTILDTIDSAPDNLEDLTTATWTVDASGANLRIRVTGETATNLTWYAKYDLQYIQYEFAP